MKCKEPHSKLHITFHNPNTDEETAKFIAKCLAQSFAEKMIPSIKLHKEAEKCSG